MRDEGCGRPGRRGSLVSRRISHPAQDRRVAVTTPWHEDIRDMLKRRYVGPIMNNVYRGDYVECMIVSPLWVTGV